VASSSFGHPKERRLRQRREFLAVQASGVRVHTPHFLLVVARAPEQGKRARLGITVTRKVAGAVGRNRCKRLVREAFRLDPELLPDGVDLLVIVKDGTPSLGLADVQAEWGRVRSTLRRRAKDVLARPPAPPAAPRT
jgi:ribonuclease P protein component